MLVKKIERSRLRLPVSIPGTPRFLLPTEAKQDAQVNVRTILPRGNFPVGMDFYDSFVTCSLPFSAAAAATAYSSVLGEWLLPGGGGGGREIRVEEEGHKDTLEKERIDLFGGRTKKAASSPFPQLTYQRSYGSNNLLCCCCPDKERNSVSTEFPSLLRRIFKASARPKKCCQLVSDEKEEEEGKSKSTLQGKKFLNENKIRGVCQYLSFVVVSVPQPSLCGCSEINVVSAIAKTATKDFPPRK